MGVKKNLSFEKPFFLFKLGSLSKLSGENVELKYITGGSVCVCFFFLNLHLRFLWYLITCGIFLFGHLRS